MRNNGRKKGRRGGREEKGKGRKDRGKTGGGRQRMRERRGERKDRRKELTGIQLGPFIYSLSTATFMLQSEIMWPEKPQVFITWPFTEKACRPLT